MIDSSRTPERPQQPNSETVRVNHDGNNVAEVDVEAVETLFEGIKKYNDQFTIERVLERSRVSNFEEEKPPWPVDNKSLIKEVVNQEILAINLSCRYEQTLKQIGLTLEPVSGKRVTFIDNDTYIGDGELRLNIVDGERFVSFLSVLSPDQVVNPNLKDNLKNLSKIFTSQILNQYDLSNPNDEALQLFGHMAGIIDQYKRLGLGDSIEKMEIYLTHMRQGNLREYVAIEKEILFKGCDYWRLVKWQTEPFPYRLRERWDKAFEVLRAIGVNPKARELYEKLINNLKNCVDEASLNIPKPKTSEREFGFFMILDEVKFELDRMSLKK